MRELIDVKGYRVHVESVKGYDAYSGMLEGTPYLARKLRLLRCKKALEIPGNYVFGVPELEREIAALDGTCTEWAPREEWHARLSGGIQMMPRMTPLPRPSNASRRNLCQTGFVADNVWTIQLFELN